MKFLILAYAMLMSLPSICQSDKVEVVVHFQNQAVNCRFKGDSPIYDELADVWIDSIIGYSSKTGNPMKNMQISQERAYNVASELGMIGDIVVKIMGRGETTKFGIKHYDNQRVVIYGRRVRNVVPTFTNLKSI